MPPNNKILKPDGTLDYDALGVSAPEHLAHGTDEDIRAHLQIVKPIRWFQRGNELVAETDLGEVVNFLPTNYMLSGTDRDNRPILIKIHP
jgi:hypothetical protein